LVKSTYKPQQEANTSSDILGNEPITLPPRTIYIKREIVNAILIDAKNAYPRECILLLKGKVRKESILINDSIIPFLPTRGRNFSTFPLYMLPLDLTVVGTAHSHPSGNPNPSPDDLNHFYGRIMVIAAYPYSSDRDMAVYDGNGRVGFEIVED
jgi:proteasome lid subunit RPN8/RPN11